MLQRLLNHTWFQLLITLLAGGVLPLAFSPFHFYGLAVICPALLLAVTTHQNWRQTLLRGFLFGFSFFAVGCSWVIVSIHRYGNANLALALFITLLLVLFLSLYWILQAAIYKFCVGDTPKFKTLRLLFIFPASIVLTEWLRSTIFTGFPWLLLGYSQTNSLLKFLIPWLGVYGMTFVLGLAASALYLLVTGARVQRIVACFVLGLIAICSVISSQINFTKPVGQPISVAMVQGNIAQAMKWQPDALLAILQQYVALTADQWHNQLVIWPEGAIPYPKQYATEFLAELDQKAKQTHVDFLTGIPVQAGDGEHYYNAILQLGNEQGHYYKYHLVPFGEYLPLEKLLRGLIGFFNIPMSSFIAGDEQQPLLKMKSGILIAPYICYEVAYPNEMIRTTSNANLLLAISDDNWFGDSMAPGQQMQMAQFHAIETQKYLLSATNSGVTAVIDNQGHFIAHAPSFVATVLNAKVQGMSGLTPIMHYGLTPILLLSLLLLIAAVCSCRLCSRR